MHEVAFNDVEALQALILRYQDHAQYIDTKNRENILRLCINLCIQKSAKGHPAFGGVLYHLFQWALAQKGNFSARWLRTDDDFLNIALIIGNAGHLVEMEDFMKRYAVFLPKIMVEEAQLLARAYYHFFKHQWEESIALAGKIRSTEPKYMFRIQILRLCIAYEQGIALRDYEMVHRQVNTFCTYFKRTAVLTEARKKEYIRLGRFVKKMTVARGNLNANLSKRRIRLEKALLNPDEPAPIGFTWLQQQIMALSS
jgi:hypothetical protein